MNPLSDSDPFGQCFWDACIIEGAIVSKIFIGTAAAIGAALGGAALYDWWDDDDIVGDDPYGGYTSDDEDDALDLADSLTGEESCELIQDAIDALDNRIRGRQQNLDDHFGEDAGHIERINKLIEDRKLLLAALNNCC